MTSIIFGVNGQDGTYLKELLQSKNGSVIGISRQASDSGSDITDYKVVSDLISKHKPDYIFHLAANSTTNHNVILENYATISTGSINILEAVKNYSPFSKVFISGSGLQFRNEGKPIKETDPFEARDAYSVSRIQSVYAARYFRSLGIKAYVGYFFNHDSPLRTERHMTKKIAETAKRIGAGSKEKLAIGDVDAIKEYAYAGDIVRGIWTLMNQDEIMEANISSGKGYSIRDWLEQCFSIVKKDWKNYVTANNNFVLGYRQLVSDPSLIFSLGWKPEISFEELANMMMK